MKRRSAVLLAASLLSAAIGPGSVEVSAATPRGADAPDAFALNQRLGRGVNVLGYDPIWRHPERGRFRAEHFRLIRDAGFDHLRINLHPFRDNRGDIRDQWWKTLDWAVDHALEAGLLVVLDFHEFQAMSRDPAGLKERFLSFWSQLAERCKNRPDGVLFEILNEPHAKYTPELWNETLREALAVIRRGNPTRGVIVGPVQWNSFEKLDTLSLPSDDRNLIATVHYYNPFAFTHQGASWTNMKDKLGVKWTASPQEQEAVRRDFDRVRAWSEKERRPIYLGEFGAYGRAEMPSRARYTNFIAREAEKRGWSWAYWQFDGDFIVYDVLAGKWIEPIRDALVKPRRGE
ncbi:MAG: glycoside hydrolase family 5 protein [Isosphaeraceae bacterium]